jgi:hypothetical protein
MLSTISDWTYTRKPSVIDKDGRVSSRYSVCPQKHEVRFRQSASSVFSRKFLSTKLSLQGCPQSRA